MEQGLARRGGRRRLAGEREAAPFELRVAQAGRAALARIDGPLSGEHCPRLLDGVRPLCRGLRRVVLDLRRTQYIDSSGIRALLQLQQEVEAGKGELRLVVMPGSRVERTLSLLRLTAHFQTFGTASEAWIRAARTILSGADA